MRSLIKCVADDKCMPDCHFNIRSIEEVETNYRESGDIADLVGPDGKVESMLSISHLTPSDICLHWSLSLHCVRPNVGMKENSEIEGI